MQQPDFQTGDLQQQTIKNAPEININGQNGAQMGIQNSNSRLRDADDELIDEIDEIIETDPDESQHHPIVDGDADEPQQYEINNNEEYNKSQKDNNMDDQDVDDQFNHNFMQFDGYDSRFFTANNKNSMGEEDQNDKLNTQQNKTRATSAQRKQIMNKPPLINSSEARNNLKQDQNYDSNQQINDQFMPTPTQSQKFANFSVTRPLSSAKLRPSDTQKRDRLLSAHHKNNQKIKVLNTQDQRDKISSFRRNIVIQPQNQMYQNQMMRSEGQKNKFYQTQQQFSSNGREQAQNHMQGMPTPNRNLNIQRGGPPMSAQSSNASLQPPYPYIQHQSPNQYNEKYGMYYPQIFDNQLYAGQGYMQHQMQIQPFVYESPKYNHQQAMMANGMQPNLMAPYSQGNYNQQQIGNYFQNDLNQRSRQQSQTSLLLQAHSEIQVQQKEEAKVISVLDTNVENFQKFDIFQNHIKGLCKKEQVKYTGTYNTFIKQLNEGGITKVTDQSKLQNDQKAKKEAISLKKTRRQKRIKDKKQSQEDEDNDEHIIYRSSNRVQRDNMDFGTYAINQDMNIYQQPSDMGFQDNQFYSDQNLVMPNQAQGMEYQMVNQQQELQEREKLRQKQKNMQLQEKQFRLSMSSMKNQISEVINEDLNESIKSNTGRENIDNSFQKPKSKPIVETDKENTPIIVEKGAQDIQEKIVTRVDEENSKSDVKQKKQTQEPNKQDVQAFQIPNEPIEVFNLEHEDDVLPEAETQLINNIFKTQKDEYNQAKEKNDGVKDQIKDLMIIKQQQSEMLLNQFQVPPDKKISAGNDQPISYEAFFKNPSGKSENNNIMEDDLLQNQNKSATVVEDQLTFDEVEEEEVTNTISPDQVKNPFCQDNDMFNDEYQASITIQGQKAQGDNIRKRQRSNSSRIENKRENNESSEQKKRADGSQYSQISQQIEGITNLLQNLNNYVVSSTADQKVEAANSTDMKETRFSYKMNKVTNFQGLPELPEEPNEQAENEMSNGDIKETKKGNQEVIPQMDHRSNADAHTLKTTQQSSKHGINTDSQEGIINIQVQNNKKSPIRQSGRKNKNQIRIKKIKRKALNQNLTLKKSLSLNNVKSPERKSQEQAPIPFKCGSFRPQALYNSHSPEQYEKRSLSPNMNRQKQRSYLKSAHPSVNIQSRYNQGNVTYKKITFKKMKTMHDKKKRSLGSMEHLQQQMHVPQRLQNSMSSLGFSSSHMMSQTLRQQNIQSKMGHQQQFLSSQSLLPKNNYLPTENSKALRANRATTATRQQAIGMNSGQFLSNNRVFSAQPQQLQNKYNPGDQQQYINIQNQDTANQELFRHQMPMMYQSKYAGTVRAPMYNQERFFNRDQYSSQASGDLKIKGKYNNQIEHDLQFQGQGRRMHNNSSSPFRGQTVSNYIQQGNNSQANQMMQLQQVQQTNGGGMQQPDLVRYDLPQHQLDSPYNQKMRLNGKNRRPVSNKKNGYFFQTQRIGSQEFNMEQRPPIGSYPQPLNDTRTQRMYNVNSQQFHGNLHDQRMSVQQPSQNPVGGAMLRPQSSAPHLGGNVMQQPGQIPPIHQYMNQNKQIIRPFTQIQQTEKPGNENRIQSAQGRQSASQNMLFNDYQTKQSIPPLPQNSKQRITSGKTKRQDLGANLSAKGSKHKRAASSSRPRIASANLRSTLRSSRISGGKDSKNSKKSSQKDRQLNQNTKKQKKQGVPNGQNNNNENVNNNNQHQNQQNMQQPVVIQQIFGLGYSNMAMQNPQGVSQQ